MDRFDPASHEENGDGLWDWNLTTNRIFYSPRWVSLLGCEEQQVANTPEEWFQRIHPEDLKQVQQAIDAYLAGASTRLDTQHRMLHADGTYRWMSCRGVIVRDGKGQPVRMTGSHADITAAKVTDALTGLPNRLLLLDRLAGSIERARRHHDFLFAVLLLDLDRFQSHVERLGSPAGDQLLIAVARRLETSLRAGDTVARLGRDHVVTRLGGDEFVILLDGLNEIGKAKVVADRLLRELAAPFRLEGHEVFITASIGAALSVTGYNCPEEALRDADIAVHRAKSLGKARCEVFDTAILDSAQARLQLESDLQGAMGRQEFSVLYQPVLSLISGRIAGFEALLRWNHPVRGTVSPLEFISIAERTGLIIPLGRWVLHEACRQLKAWRQMPEIPKDLWISVNFSSLQFRQSAVVTEICGILNEVGIDPGCLLLELTESVVMDNPEAVRSLLMQLRVFGVRIALDDFGAGYSSLGYLRQLPLDVIKIDRSFIRRMETSKDALEIVRTIDHLAHQLGLSVVAEGIENSEELQLIRSTNCEYGQGYIFSRAVDSERCAELLKADLHKAQSERGCAGTEMDSSGRYFEPTCVPASVEDHSDQPPSTETSHKAWRETDVILTVMGLFILLWVSAFVVKMNGRGQPYSAVAQNSFPSSAQTPAEVPGMPSAPEPPHLAAANRGPQLQAVASTSSPVAPKSSDAGNERHTPVKSEAKLSPKAVSGRSSPGETSSYRPPGNESEVRTFPVVHFHTLGNCQGILKITQKGLSFVSEKDKDSFAVNYSECFCSLSKDRLLIRSGSRTYRFKSATAVSKEENLSQLRDIVQIISSRQQVN